MSDNKIVLTKEELETTIRKMAREHLNEQSMVNEQVDVVRFSSEFANSKSDEDRKAVIQRYFPNASSVGVSKALQHFNGRALALAKDAYSILGAYNLDSRVAEAFDKANARPRILPLESAVRDSLNSAKSTFLTALIKNLVYYQVDGFSDKGGETLSMEAGHYAAIVMRQIFDELDLEGRLVNAMLGFAHGGTPSLDTRVAEAFDKALESVDPSDTDALIEAMTNEIFGFGGGDRARIEPNVDRKFGDMKEKLGVAVKQFMRDRANPAKRKMASQVIHGMIGKRGNPSQILKSMTDLGLKADEVWAEILGDVGARM